MYSYFSIYLQVLHVICKASCMSNRLPRYWVNLINLIPFVTINSLLPALLFRDTKSTRKNKNLAWRYVEKIDIEATDTIQFDISISKRYIDIFVVGRITSAYCPPSNHSDGYLARDAVDASWQRVRHFAVYVLLVEIRLIYCLKIALKEFIHE